MSTHGWFEEIQKVIPGFDLGRCQWLRQVDVWEEGEERRCRLVLDYEGRLSVALVAKGVNELPLFAETAPGVLPYAPYDLGELLVSVDPSTCRVIIFDELKGWRMAADSLSFEGVTSHRGAMGE
jgi:hypothetical protein